MLIPSIKTFWYRSLSLEAKASNLGRPGRVSHLFFSSLAIPERSDLRAARHVVVAQQPYSGRIRIRPICSTNQRQCTGRYKTTLLINSIPRLDDCMGTVSHVAYLIRKHSSIEQFNPKFGWLNIVSYVTYLLRKHSSVDQLFKKKKADMFHKPETVHWKV